MTRAAVILSALVWLGCDPDSTTDPVAPGPGDSAGSTVADAAADTTGPGADAPGGLPDAPDSSEVSATPDAGAGLPPIGHVEKRADGLPSSTEGLAFDGLGSLWVGTLDGHLLRLAADGTVAETVDLGDGLPTNGLGRGPDGAIYLARPGPGQIVRFVPGAAGPPSVVASGLRAPNGLTVGPDGTIWYSESGDDAKRDGAVGRVVTGGAPEVLASGIGHANGVALSLDGAWLYFAETVPGRLHRLPLLPTPGAAELLSDDERLTLVDGLVTGADGGVYACGFARGMILAWAGGALHTVVEDPGLLGAVASLAFGEGPGFDPTALYATNLIQRWIVKIALEPR